MIHEAGTEEIGLFTTEVEISLYFSKHFIILLCSNNLSQQPSTDIFTYSILSSPAGSRRQTEQKQKTHGLRPRQL